MGSKFSFGLKGSSHQTEDWLKKMAQGDIFDSLSRYGEEGVRELAKATPKESGETANAWSYEILKDGKSYSIIWSNSNIVGGTPVAVLLQVGHATRNGAYIQGVDYINPALRPVFDRMASEAWKKVTST